MPEILRTTVIGSYPQPDWLVDRAMLGGRLPPRVRAREIWRVPPEHLEHAQDDATLLAIRDLERAGVDIITDGEIRRESYSNRFATALEGMDIDRPGTAIDRTGHPTPVPAVRGPVRRRHAVEVRDIRFLRENTDRQVKITLPGPFTMTQQAQDDHYAADYLAIEAAQPRLDLSVVPRAILLDNRGTRWVACRSLMNTYSSARENMEIGEADGRATCARRVRTRQVITVSRPEGCSAASERRTATSWRGYTCPRGHFRTPFKNTYAGSR